ncbi:50S ribosomal protein L24 [Candidatus Johnevansia muelleri]|uniref:Large ribosomal subunit protein uL24 n=1 Tax=Candidatus Johnevansia muelleri TaxID=1495769 RepID=A0A078KDU6_9GAMM|nr:50S ribosomal protein L24 [Candidatus Evansia muelleri]
MLKRKDNIRIISGKEKGNTGFVKDVIKNCKIIVKGFHIVKRNIKKSNFNGKSQPGHQIYCEAPIHHSNLAINKSESQKSESKYNLYLKIKYKLRIK